MVSQLTFLNSSFVLFPNCYLGRHTLAAPLGRVAFRRQLSTEPTTDDSKTVANAEVTSWPTVEMDKKKARPTIVSNQRKKQKVMAESILSLGSSSGHAHQGAAWSKPHQLTESSPELTPLQQWQEFNRIQKHTRALGSQTEGRYITTQLVANPPKPEEVTLELLMASQTHMGHNTSLWNPSNSRYIYGVREGIHIISLETTAAHLRRAARVVEDVAFRGGLILIVGTRKGQMEIVTKAAALAGACHVFTKWTPGAITNRDVILQNARTQVVGKTDEKLDNFEVYASSSRPLMPDLVVCLNPKENYTLLAECGLKDIPTIGVIDTDANPTWVTYTIPANDDRLVDQIHTTGTISLENTLTVSIV